MILTSSISVLGSLLSPVYFRFLLDKTLLDTQAIKTVLLDIPSLGRQTTSTASYSKFVTREMSKAEALLKFVADTYHALLPKGSPMEFQRILEFKDLKKADQQSILDDFNKHGRGITQPAAIVPLVAPPATPAISPAMTASSDVGFIASREYVLTRVAALGRGAATTGFKWFLALTEADKDCKDGSFRKLFNT